MVTAPAMLSVCDGTECLGFILSRGKQGHEAFDREQKSLGVFTTVAAAADVVAKSSANEEGAR